MLARQVLGGVSLTCVTSSEEEHAEFQSDISNPAQNRVWGAGGSVWGGDQDGRRNHIYLYTKKLEVIVFRKRNSGFLF